MKQKPQSIVVLTGAGISAESGLKTFRDNGGLWEGHKVEEVATPEAFNQNPKLVHRFYNLRRNQLLTEAKPNAAHIALAEFEESYTGNFALITQNVDNLHEKSGSTNVFHMHGELLKIRCENSNIVYSVDPESNEYNHEIPLNLDINSPCPCCDSVGNLRPHIVWFGEIPLYMNEIEQALAGCDLFVSIGTSGNVYPAAGFVQIASYNGANCVELNLEKSQQGNLFHESYFGNATDIVPKFFNTLLNAVAH